MKDHGLTSIADLIGDMLVYRNLQPLDQRLPALSDVAIQLNIPDHPVPRKTEPDYARIMVHLLSYARSLVAGQTRLQRLIYIGDTHMNDGTAFQNLCRMGGWPGIAFIGSETRDPAAVTLNKEGGQPLYLANRWSLLEDFDRHCRKNGQIIDAGTAIILDIDKTVLGARGRNDHVINEARVDAVCRTAATLLGDACDIEAFEASYALLNQVEFHPLTTDNQDYLAYLCLMLATDLFSVTSVVEEIRSGRLTAFGQFLETVQRRSSDLPAQLQELHNDIYRRVLAGDPTPFKTFRCNEYQATVDRMGNPELAEADAATLLAREIVITQEVWEVTRAWQAEGAMAFGLSDKPDEASMPTATLARRGYRPLHKTSTHMIGGREQPDACGPQ